LQEDGLPRPYEDGIDQLLGAMVRNKLVKSAA